VSDLSIIDLVGLCVAVVAAVGIGVISIIFFSTKRKATSPIRVGRIKSAKMRCKVCNKPLEDDDIVLYRDGETPWHIHHKETT